MKVGRFFCLLALALSVAGCGSSRQAASSESGTGPVTPVGHLALGNRNDQRLVALWAERYGKRSEFPIGSGDVLQVSVPGLDEFKERTVRVDEDGNISMPLLGTFRAAGLSEDGVRNGLLSRLGKYMYHPQVDLFVKSFSSRQVGVLGEVHSPAMYTLNGPADTVREMIQRAGGITDNAAQEVLLTPAPVGERTAAESTSLRSGAVKNVAMAGRQGSNADRADVHSGPQPSSQPTLDEPLRRDVTVSPLVISLASHDYERFLDMPVVPGDTIYVPRAGDVTVVGWVYTPKVISITPGLTVLGAVSAAGGALYASDMTSVKVIRQGGNGQIIVLKVDLDKVKKREAPDVPVKANDVVEVGYSTLRLPGYAVYYALQGVFMWSAPMMVTAGVP